MDLPITHKLTILNMDLSFEDLHFNDPLDGNDFHSTSLKILFVKNLDLERINNIKIDSADDSLWVWAPSTLKTTISASVYDFMNYNGSDFESLKGWNSIWKLCYASYQDLHLEISSWKVNHGGFTLLFKYWAFCSLSLLWIGRRNSLVSY